MNPTSSPDLVVLFLGQTFRLPSSLSNAHKSCLRSRVSNRKCTRQGPAACSRLLPSFSVTQHLLDLHLFELVSFVPQESVDNLTICEYSVSESPLDAWVSVDANGNPVATITPFLSTVNGVAKTISAAPTMLTATTTSSQGDSKPTEASGSPEGGAYEVCHNLDGDFAPLCQPSNGTALYVGQTYYGTFTLD